MTWPPRLLLSLALALGAIAGCNDNMTFPPERDAYVPETNVNPFACTPNLDGVIDYNELAPSIGNPANYLISPGELTIDPIGTINAEGKREWNYGGNSAADLAGVFTARAIEGLWYENDFPDGQFAVQLESGGNIEGIYSHDEAGLWLHGLASREATGNTLIIYDNPVQLYRFPLSPGDEWVSVGEASNAELRGLPYAGKDTYRVQVVDAGILVLPDLTFTQALRVRTEVIAQPIAGPSVTTRQIGWLFECFGEVQRATSHPGETEGDFTTAAQLRRLGL